MIRQTVFHTDDWLKITKKHFGSNVKSIFFSNKWGEFKLDYFLRKKLFLRTFMSPVPGCFAAYGGPTYDNNKNLSLILREIDRRNYSLVSFTLAPFSDIDTFIKFGYERRTLETRLIDLTLGKEGLWAGINRSRRKKINKASRSLKIINDSQGEYFPLYIDLLKITLPNLFFRNVISQKDFFIDIIRVFGKKGALKFLLAEHEGKIVAGCIHLIHNDIAYSWSSASSSDGRKNNANPLLKWKFMEWATENGLKKYDLCTIDGSRGAYKKSFGGSKIEYNIMVKKNNFLKIFPLRRLISLKLKNSVMGEK